MREFVLSYTYTDADTFKRAKFLHELDQIAQ